MERTKLMEMSLNGDYQSLSELGWLEVYDALKGWWPKRMSIEDLAPYLDALHEDPASKVMSVLRTMRGEQWRPSPSALYREMQGVAAKKQQARESEKDRYGRRKPPWSRPEALVRVRMLMDAGNPVCGCIPRPTDYRMDKYNVLQCRECGGLEQGQVWEAEDDLKEVEF
jgi:hypothetical protein